MILGQKDKNLHSTQGNGVALLGERSISGSRGTPA